MHKKNSRHIANTGRKTSSLRPLELTPGDELTQHNQQHSAMVHSKYQSTYDTAVDMQRPPDLSGNNVLCRQRRHPDRGGHITLPGARSPFTAVVVHVPVTHLSETQIAGAFVGNR